MHLLFGAVAAGCAAMVLIEGVRLLDALALARQVGAAGAGAPIADDARPEARLAHALALARAGETDPALRDYKRVIQEPSTDLRRAAQFDLGNLELRAALHEQQQGQTAQATPLIELAKQNYRDLLRDDPGAWDARYNLERALRLAPEADEAEPEDLSTPPSRERSISTLQGARIDLP
jgi:mxaK protein